MSGSWRKTLRIGWPGLVLAVTLALLAALQLHWLGQVSAADRQRTAAALETAAQRLAEDFNRDLTQIFIFFQGLPLEGREPAGDVAGWREVLPQPELVRAVYFARRGEGRVLELARLDGATGALESTAWPAELEPLRRRLEHLRRGPGPGPGPGSGRGAPRPTVPLAGDVPALVVPRPELLRRHRHGEGDSPRRPGRFSGAGYLVVQLDLDALRQQYLPRLSRRFLGRAGFPEPNLTLVDQHSGDVLYHGGPSPVPAAADAQSADASVPLFALLSPEELRRYAFDPDFSRLQPPEGERPPWPDPRDWRRLYASISARSGGQWRLLVNHPAGSLEKAVRQGQVQNLAISLGILAVLAASFLLLLRSNRRAQDLARQRLELVAGVTHELMTPLAALRSAGQNLADGVVTDPGQIRRYGTLVEKEGRRLASLVSQMLELAGIETGRKSLERQPVDLGETARAAVADCQSAIETRRMEVAVEIAPGLPAVLADPDALRLALRNLVENAVKYSPEGSRIDVRVARAGGRAEVRVRDRGPGIAAADLPHIFEPFYRSRDMVASSVHGSGLGLSLVRRIVEAFGGRVGVDTVPGEGSTFTVSLPATSETGEGPS